MDERQWLNRIKPNQQASQIIRSTNQNPASSQLGEQIGSFLMKHIPLEITEIPKKDEQYKVRNKQFVDSFCRKWIPRLYGINEYNPQYRTACLCEFIRWYVVFGIAINYNTAKAHWYWEAETQGSVPDKLRMVAGFADIIYSILWGLGIKLRYRIQTF